MSGDLSGEQTGPADERADVDAWMARGEGETVRWAGHPRVTTILPWVVLGVLFLGAGVGGAIALDRPLLALLGLPGIAIPAWAYLRVVNTRYVVTDYALYRKTGVFSRTVERVTVSRVQNSAFAQGLTGSVFGYGTVRVEAAGGGAIQFGAIDEPRAVRALVDQQATLEEIPGSRDQWEAVLEEVRRVRRAFDVRRETDEADGR
jgi:hypothetical protein